MESGIDITKLNTIDYLSEIDKMLVGGNFFIDHKYANIFCNLDVGQKMFPDKDIEKVKLAEIIPPFVDLNIIVNEHKYYIFISTKNSFKDNEVLIL